MKRVRTLFVLILLAVAMSIPITLAKKGATIQDGTIYASTGELITVGYDVFGYNYQAHMFRGRYCDYDRVIGGDYCDVNLIMKWNDAWLSNKDCVGDGLLDRHYGHATYINSGAWLTNHQFGVNPDGTHWEYFVKIVAVKSTDNLVGGIWYDATGNEIGPVIWGSFAVIQRVSNDPAVPEHGIQLNPPSPTGFGYYK